MGVGPANRRAHTYYQSVVAVRSSDTLLSKMNKWSCLQGLIVFRGTRHFGLGIRGGGVANVGFDSISMPKRNMERAIAH